MVPIKRKMLLKASLPSRSWALLGLATVTAFALFIVYQTNARSPHLSYLPPKPWATKPQPVPETIPELAIATFLTGQADGTFFNDTKLLTYQFLHDPPTKFTNPNISFVVLCGNKVPDEERNILRKMGATVISVDDVELPTWIVPTNERWSKQFTKLRLFQRTEYKRILYMDADHLILHPMDDIFNDPMIQHLASPLLDRLAEIHADEGPLPSKWLFAARPEAIGGFDHQVPPLSGDYFNAGFMLVAPDMNMFEHLMTVMRIEGRFPTGMMEQEMLNYIFRRQGPIPWRELNWKWSTNFVNEKDVEFGVHALHGKFWGEGPEYVRKQWRSTMDEMERFVQTL